MLFLRCCFKGIHRTGSRRKVGTVTPTWSLSVSSLCCTLHLLLPPNSECRFQLLARITIWRVGMGITEKQMQPVPMWWTRHGQSSAQLPSSLEALALLPHAITSPLKSPPASSLAWSTGTSLSPFLTTFPLFHFFLSQISPYLWLFLLLEGFGSSLTLLRLALKKISSKCVKAYYDVLFKLWWFRRYICHCPVHTRCFCS